jgi:elongation factor Ts
MAIDAKMVKELRDATGAAFLDCKKALEEYDGDFDKAKEHLNEQGLAIAKKKAERQAREGLIETYTHPGARVGVMVEVNCETDFVAATEQFQAFAHDIALHIAFANPLYLNESEIPEEVLEAQKTEFRDEARSQGKPDNIIERIVEGRLGKYYSEVCLLRQPFVKDDEITIDDLITQTIAQLKENIKIGRFARFELGDTVEEEDGEEE